MNPTNDILQELTELGSPLASFPRKHPFTVPEGYFEAFPAAAQQDAILSEAADPMLLLPKTLPFTVPTGYFDALPAILLDSAKYADAADPALAFSKEMPFAVPENYFAAFPEEMTLLAATPAEIAFTAETPFSVPQGYFNAFPQQLLSRIREEEALEQEEVAPVMQPAIQPVARKSRTISFMPAMRWAAAALLVLGLGFGSYKAFLSGDTKPYNLERELAGVDKKALEQYIEQNIDEFDMETLEIYAGASTTTTESIAPTPQLNAAEIENYLDETGAL